MKRLKKGMSLFFAGCLIFALFSCGNGTGNSRTDRNESEEGAVSEDETEENNTTEQGQASDNGEEISVTQVHDWS